MITHEQQARDILERMGIEGAQNFSSGEIIEIANLLRKVETLEKGAARYRFLRDIGPSRIISPPSATLRNGAGPYIKVSIPSVKGDVSIILTGTNADAAIDAALTQEQERRQ